MSVNDEAVVQALHEIAELLRTPATVAALQLPMSPAVLNAMVQAARVPGASELGIDMFSVFVPAGATVTGVIPVPDGKVAVAVEPMRVTASYYSPLITMRVWIDGAEITSPDYPYSIVADDLIEYGQYYYALTTSKVTITNNTAFATIVTFRAVGLKMDRIYFQEVYNPAIQYSYQRMEEMIRQVKRGGARS